MGRRCTLWCPQRMELSPGSGSPQNPPGNPQVRFHDVAQSSFTDKTVLVPFDIALSPQASLASRGLQRSYTRTDTVLQYCVCTDLSRSLSLPLSPSPHLHTCQTPQRFGDETKGPSLRFRSFVFNPHSYILRSLSAGFSRTLDAPHGVILPSQIHLNRLRADNSARCTVDNP